MGYCTIDLMNSLISLEKTKKNINILDFGCGDGRWCRSLKSLLRKANIIGYDIDKEIIKKAKKENSKIIFIDDYNSLGKNFDYIIAPFIFHDIKEELFEKTYQLLNPDGRLFIADYQMKGISEKNFLYSFNKPAELATLEKLGTKEAYKQHTSTDISDCLEYSKNKFDTLNTHIIKNEELPLTKYFVWEGIKKN